MSQAVRQNYGSENQEHGLGKVEVLCENDAERHQNKPDALRRQESCGRHMHTSNAEDVGCVTFAYPILFGNMN